jgi:hypothetical protein
MTKPKKDRRGGARAGAGRPENPPKEWSDEIKQDLVDNLKKIEKEKGKSWLRLLAELPYDMRTPAQVRIGALRLIAEITVIKESKKTVVEEKRGVILLPGVMPKPQKIIDAEKEYDRLPERTS